MKVTKTLLSETMAASVLPLMLVLCLAFGQPLHGFAQTQAQPDAQSAKLNEPAQPIPDAAAHESSTSSVKPAEAPKRIEDPEALAKELEAMKLRIEQLEPHDSGTACESNGIRTGQAKWGTSRGHGNRRSDKKRSILFPTGTGLG
jgi:hypothetical protein